MVKITDNYEDITDGQDEIIRSIVDGYVTRIFITNEIDPLHIQKILMRHGYYEAFLVLEENEIVKYE